MKHQLRITLANLKKTAFTSSLNLLGLTCAFAAFILIMLYVWNEYKFDKFHHNAENIYRLEMKNPDENKSSVFMLGPTGQTLVDALPEIVNSSVYMSWGKWGEESFSYFTKNEEQKSYEDYAFSDENLTDIFSFNFIYGNSRNPLGKPETAIVSESFAQKAWGNIDPTGEILNVNGLTYSVAGVFAELPENSVFTCPIILKIPSSGFIAEEKEKWNFTNYPQFIQAKPGVSEEELNKLINEQPLIQSKYRFFDNGNTSAEIIARPLADLRFTKEVNESPMFESNNKSFVNSLFVVGILILLIALINYINFATANMPARKKTINISRIIGSKRWHAASQLIFETLIIFVVSFVLALSLAHVLNQLFSANILGYKLPFTENIPLFLGSAIIAFLAAIIAAGYPAIISTIGKPIDDLKHKGGETKTNLRGSLIVFQFAATIALIIASLSVIKQVRFMEEKDLGFNKNNTLVLPITQKLRKNYNPFREQLLASPYISDVAASRSVPGKAMDWNTLQVDGKTCSVWNWAVDDEYIEMMNFEIVEGRTFLKNSEAENGNFICNQTAAERYGWEVGMEIGDNQLVGIMKDFNLISLRESIDPFVFHKSSSFNEFTTISIKLEGNNSQAALNAIQSTYELFETNSPFRGYFLDDHLNLLYVKENQQARLITFFSMLSVIISILGILGLSIFMCQQKIKEIGIRKVNGAKTTEVITMLNKNFIKWVVIAFILATPVAWYVLNKWLENFAFQTELSWWIFALAGISAMGIAILTVSYQSYKAANRNPVEALRYE